MTKIQDHALLVNASVQIVFTQQGRHKNAVRAVYAWNDNADLAEKGPSNRM